MNRLNKSFAYFRNWFKSNKLQNSREPSQEVSHETTLTAKEHWVQLVAQLTYSELGFHDSLRHIVSLLGKDFQWLLQEEAVQNPGAGVANV